MASSLAILVLLLLRFSLPGAVAVSSSSYISRTTEQQIIATVAPAAFADEDADDDGQSGARAQAQPFLASPSGSFAAYLRRAAVDDGDGGGDVCYVEVVQQQGGGGGTSSVWESDCTPVGGADTCDLAFSPVGLELFAGGHSLWDTAVDSDPAMLSLDGAGDMRIVSRDGVTVWRTRDEPWTGRRCGAAMALPVSSPSTDDALPTPAATSTLASPWGSDFTFGDQTAPPPDTSTDQMMPPPPPADDDDDDDSADSPDLPLPPPPPPSDPSTDWPDLQLPPPPADTYVPIPESPDQPLNSSPPPADTYVPIPESPEQPLYSSPPPADTHPIPESPDLPLYSSPPPAPTAFAPPPPLPALGTPPLVPSPGASIAKPPASPGDDDVPFPPPPVGTPHPHHLPMVASPPPVPGAVAPISGGHGPLPFGQGQGQGQHGQGQGVFGQQQNQLLNGGGQPLEDSAGGWPGRERGGAGVSLAFVALVALAIGF